MQIFLNETSVHGQYQSVTEFTESIRLIVRLFSLINQRVRDKETAYTKILWSKAAINDERFQQNFSQIRNRQLRNLFRNTVLNRREGGLIDWTTQQKHSEQDMFSCPLIDDDLAGTSVAELSERLLSKQIEVGLLVNFCTSCFADETTVPVSVERNSGGIDNIQIGCVDNESTLTDWLRLHLPPEYDTSSTIPPKPEQTVLADVTRFTKTSHRVQGQAVFLEKETGQYWYIDNLHFGEAAEIEVFDANGKHLGTADLEGNLDESKRKIGRTINL